MKPTRILLTIIGVVAILTLFQLPYLNRKVGLFNNQKLIEGSYEMNDSYLPSEVILFNLFENHPDSLRNWVTTLDQKNPKLLVFDYFLESSDSLQKIELATHFILPMTIEDDSTTFSENPFSGNFSYGVINFSNNIRFDSWIKDKDGTSYPALATAIVTKAWNSDIEKFKDRLIKWSPRTKNTYIHDFNTFSKEQYDDEFTDKIVLLGYFGDDVSWPEPMPSEWVDVHETPIGKIFGPITVLNAYNTLRTGVPNEYSLPINFLISVIVGFLGFYGITRIRTRNWALMILYTQIIVFAGLVLSFLTIYYLAAIGHFLNIELISISILVCWETSLILGLKTMSNKH
ncbi:MAG: hypothetical protein RIF46_00235 [Cyclobacteriaceae bacterium]